MNHAQFEERLALVRSTLEKHGLEATNITPLEYDENCPFPYNNFIYKVELAAAASPASFSRANQACTSPPPVAGVSTLIFRLSNPSAEGLNQATRVQNEVAALHLARDGRASSVIPAVYDWHPRVGTEMGWILMEFKPGVGLDQHFENLSEEQKEAVIGQIADVFATVQGAALPKTATAYGGLTIDEDGTIVSGEMTTLEGGPWQTFAGFLKARLASKLNDADKSPALRGWKDNGVRERVDAFLDSGLDTALQESGVDEGQRVLVHGDLTTNNILFDPATAKVTGLVDFDFSYVGHPFQEFLSSFGDVAGVSWDNALTARGIFRPDAMPGAGTLKLLGRLEELLSPFRLVHPVFLGQQTAERIAERRAEAEKDLLACLDELGA
ncbi:phosphotransferase enzyme family protein [Cercophora newfieldiana]|uniref:Phosphotransferase enzyme family protein n=1 Tax=Cercophora newfieldiana TaxID=92897 RepID=A0AA40CLT8_9PEZI|nr:phosphotransferase enzyme family protein [Cercophora newfieldiana]